MKLRISTPTAYTRLFRHTTAKQEKINIVRKFDSVETIKNQSHFKT